MAPMLRPALAALCLALPLPAGAQETVPPPASEIGRVISVMGEGQSSQKPDLARIMLGVAQQGTTANEAMAAMSRSMEGILARLRQEGIAPADIQTGFLYLEPQWDYNAPDGRPRMTGFSATQIVNVTLRDIARLGTVLDAAVTDGANRVDGVTFEVSDPAAAMDEARRRAVEDARRRATLYAEAAGLTLGALLSISEVGPYATPMPMADARDAAEAMAVPVAPGEVTMGTTVTVTFAASD
ncbi:SIMPL domain-containing protein [Rubellimicrobium sp. CFH 75288]|uniref:SIMPL domain-containing protein n=1 Tax=Rubellimicrobium sp. CFH 75288 TaxID=2697034 RepID=UPI001412A1E2|nr:SIMPL domain-containing protein [Rubellimicrobium sp. CFH 75288]NAZ35477.1 DUF541 domain-containing protein [Rubellimicrobium sp. CFH 75288]